MEHIFHFLFGGGCGEHSALVPFIGNVTVSFHLVLFQVRVSWLKLKTKVKGSRLPRHP